MDDEVIYHIADSHVPLKLDTDSGTVWANEYKIAKIFQTTVDQIRAILQDIYGEGTLAKDSTCRISNDAEDVSEPALEYNLDLILIIGFRLNSAGALEFQRWVTRLLVDIARNGFVINDGRIAEDENAQKALAKKIRDIRLTEKEQYKAIRDVFKASSSDYDKDSEIAREFFRTVQNKFYYAVTEKTAAQLKHERANSEDPNFGLVSQEGDHPVEKDAQIAKNYLQPHELELLQNVAEQWLLFAQGNAMRGKKMTMAELLHRVHQLLEFNKHPVMWEHPGGPTAKEAEMYVKKEWAKYKELPHSQTKALQSDPPEEQ